MHVLALFAKFLEYRWTFCFQSHKQDGRAAIVVGMFSIGGNTVSVSRAELCAHGTRLIMTSPV